MPPICPYCHGMKIDPLDMRKECWYCIGTGSKLSSIKSVNDKVKNIDSKRGIKEINMIANLENMRKCQSLPNVIMLDEKGNEYSADPGDYFFLGNNDTLKGCELAVKIINISYRDPISSLEKLEEEENK